MNTTTENRLDASLMSKVERGRLPMLRDLIRRDRHPKLKSKDGTEILLPQVINDFLVRVLDGTSRKLPLCLQANQSDELTCNRLVLITRFILVEASAVNAFLASCDQQPTNVTCTKTMTKNLPMAMNRRLQTMHARVCSHTKPHQ